MECINGGKDKARKPSAKVYNMILTTYYIYYQAFTFHSLNFSLRLLLFFQFVNSPPDTIGRRSHIVSHGCECGRKA